MGQRGLTLIEVIIVVAIMGILAGASYPIIGNTSARDVDNIARELAADLEWMQQLSKNSLSTGLPAIEFTAETPFAYDIKVGTTTLKPRVAFPSTVIITQNPGNFNFKTNGTCSSSKTIILQGGNVSRKIMIEENGRIHISDASS